MAETFLTFQKFNNEEIAQELLKLLSEHNINVETEDNYKFFDPTFAANPLAREIRIKLHPQDFDVARKLLESHYKQTVDTTDKDYYLFEFSDQELTEIIMKPDEWGDFDYQLAQKILKDRGKEIKPEIADLLRKQRNDDLARPETSNRYILYLGYISAILGGLLGVLIGWHLSYSKKILPDGRHIFRFTENERDHGTRILIIGIVSLIFWLLIRFYFLNE